MANHSPIHGVYSTRDIHSGVVHTQSSLARRSRSRREPEKLIHLFSTDVSVVVFVGAFILVLIVVFILIEVIVIVAEGTLQRGRLF